MRYLFLLSALLVLVSCKDDPTGPAPADLSHTVINGLWWTNMNLEVTTFRNGDTIPRIDDAKAWVAAGKAKQPAWCYADNADSNGRIYGKLYNWWAVADPRGLAPQGWHVADTTEWNSMVASLGQNPGTQLKRQTGWNGWAAGGNGTNTSGFSGLPGGYRGNAGAYYTIGIYGAFWTSSSFDSSQASLRFLYCNDSLVYPDFYDKARGLSVRCVKDH